jgi:hypothetical protein
MQQWTKRGPYWCVVLLTMLCVSSLPTGCRLRRTVPIPYGDKVAWQGDIVSVWDYCYGPGAHDNQIEWVGPTGERQKLTYVGDHDAELKLLPDGRLQAHFYDQNSRTSGELQYVVLTWQDRHSAPTKQVVRQEP